jgi:hypothetical protein
MHQTCADLPTRSEVWIELVQGPHLHSIMAIVDVDLCAGAACTGSCSNLNEMHKLSFEEHCWLHAVQCEQLEGSCQDLHVFSSQRWVTTIAACKLHVHPDNNAAYVILHATSSAQQTLSRYHLIQICNAVVYNLKSRQGLLQCGLRGRFSCLLDETSNPSAHVVTAQYQLSGHSYAMLVPFCKHCSKVSWTALHPLSCLCNGCPAGPCCGTSSSYCHYQIHNSQWELLRWLRPAICCVVWCLVAFAECTCTGAITPCWHADCWFIKCAAQDCT